MATKRKQRLNPCVASWHVLNAGGFNQSLDGRPRFRLVGVGGRAVRSVRDAIAVLDRQTDAQMWPHEENHWAGLIADIHKVSTVWDPEAHLWFASLRASNETVHTAKNRQRTIAIVLAASAALRAPAAA